MRNRLPLRVLLLITLVVAFFLLIQHRTLTTLAQVDADKRPKPTPTPKAQPKHTTTHSTPQPLRFRPSDPKIKMVLIPAGTFLMGSPDGVGNDDEHPQHRVTVRCPYCSPPSRLRRAAHAGRLREGGAVDSAEGVQHGAVGLGFGNHHLLAVTNVYAVDCLRLFLFTPERSINRALDSH